MEAQRTFCLDWARRIDNYKFTVAPPGVLPVRYRRKAKGLTLEQARAEVRGWADGSAYTRASTINSASAPAPAGEKDIEQAWTAVCAAS